MTKVTSYKSNISNALIPDSDVWTITIAHETDGRKPKYVMHVSSEEAEELIAKADKLESRRGRPRGSRNRPKEETS